jgi:hypothetical protein
MPEIFREFLICKEFSEDDLSKVATYPDLLDHDNVIQCAEIHHAHSYKLAKIDGKFKWLEGDCLKTIEALCAFALDTWKEYVKVTAWPLAYMTRYALAKVTHYVVDSRTWPHLHKGHPWNHYHVPFEAKVGHWLTEYQYELDPFEFGPYHHVYRSCMLESHGAWEIGLEVVNRLEAGEKLTDQDCLMASRRCIQGIGDIWLTLSQQLGICR